jgi:large subunit ribosomal protein L17
MLKNLASALFLTERDASLDENAPKVTGRITTTLHKAKEVRPLVEKCITIAKKSIPAAEAAEQYATTSDRGSEEYRRWRKSDQWQQWAEARAPVVAAQRRVVRLLGDKEAARVLFDTVAQRFVDRPGGYTRIMRLATPRLGDAGERAILELVGRNDRVKREAERPSFDMDETPADESADESVVAEQETAEPNTENPATDVEPSAEDQSETKSERSGD